ncbi:hypothetical protein SASPL_105907 [Salvia splendens]|uniref:Bidirectional sugar transporter SWEET n=1 Tax=Salvia splendens TaxID=180675 RepID=A0A8X8YRE1_SALSN|nr:hypothetical protein SASPL_105907 [Salvia splendens]
MDTLVFFIGVIGNVISVLMFLSPGKTFVRIVKKKSTEEFESFPYVCTLLNSSLWTYYGIIKPGSYLVATVNGFGVVVEIVYVALFLIFAPPNKRVRTAIVVGILNVGFLAATLLATYFLLEIDLRIDAIGFISSGLNILMYASPLSAMLRVLGKPNQQVPNSIGFALGALQLLLYAIYRNPKNSDSSPPEFDTNQISQTEPLLPNC